MEPVFKLLAAHLPKIGAIANNGSQQMLALSLVGFALPLALPGVFSFVDTSGAPMLANYRRLFDDPFVLSVGAVFVCLLVSWRVLEPKRPR